MTLEEDEDLILQRASNTLLKQLLTRIPNLLWKKGGSNPKLVHKFARQRDVDDILALVRLMLLFTFSSASNGFTSLSHLQKVPNCSIII